MPEPATPEIKSDLSRQLEQATAFHRQGRHAEAECLYQALLDAHPRDFDVVHRFGVLRLQQGMYERAIDLLYQAVRMQPGSAAAQSNLGSALLAKGLQAEALARFDAAVALEPRDTDYQFNRGKALLLLDWAEEAAACFEALLHVQPDDPELVSHSALALMKSHRLEEAIARFDCAIVLSPRDVEVHNNRGNTLDKLARHEEALASYDTAAALAPDNPLIQVNRSKVLRTLGRLQDSLVADDRALALDPEFVRAVGSKAITLLVLGHTDEALSECARAVAMAPDNPDGHHDRSVVLAKLERLDEAVAGWDRALSLDRNHFGSLVGRGNALLRQRRYSEAVADLRQALTVRPADPSTIATTSYLAYLTCNWTLAAELKAPLSNCIASGTYDGECFPLLMVFDDPEVQQAATKSFTASHVGAVKPAPPPPALHTHSKIRVGYLSADFRRHPVAFLTAELFELHDRSRFEVYGISAGKDDGSDIRKRLVRAFDRMLDVHGLSDMDLADAARSAGIDVLVDLGGFTENSRIYAFQERPAPVQATYLGYAATVGSALVDYTLVDRFVVPEEQARYFSEQLAYLPDSFQPNDRNRPIGSHIISRAACGLPERAFVFCCFNRVYKFNPTMFNLWMRLLHAVPGSVLWLPSEGNERLTEEAKARGIAPSRLVFSKFVGSNDEYLARQRLADLFLDTWPYNAHTTASDALWVGLPVLTYAGRSYASRVAGSLLHTIGLPELVTHSLADYEALAVELATTPPLLADLRKRLAVNRQTSPLFDTPRLVRHLEAAYAHMWQRHLRGEPPATFHVAPQPRLDS